jgi:phage terminase large subunit-like protein
LSDDGWRFACPDWAERLAAGRSLVPSLPINAAEGARAVALFDKLCLPDVPGRPTMAEAAGDWFRDIVRHAFGSLDKASGRRRIAEIFALVPKKNSKTTGGAAVMLTALLVNERPRARMLFVGPTKIIANLAFEQAVGMIQADPSGFLQKRFRVAQHSKTITNLVTEAVLEIKAFEMVSMTGVKPVIVLVDELHIMSSNAQASAILRQIRGGLVSNPESLLIFITTQSDGVPAGVFKSELQRARGVRDGRIEGGSLLPILYEFPEAIQTDPARPWRDPELWPQVLPNLGRSITIERLIEDYRTAEDLGDEEIARWASQHLNVEIGLGLHSNRWRGADYWLAATDPELTLESLKARCDTLVVGIDGGGLDDLLGLAVIGRDRKTRDWLSWGRAWVHPIVFERRKDIAERLRDFVADGDLVVCERPTQDLAEVAAIVGDLADSGLLPAKASVGLDPAGVAALIDELDAAGISGERLVAVPQGYRLSSAIWGGERKLADGTWRHADQPLLTWCVGNARAEQRGNAILITKEIAGRAKIDPLMAAFNAGALMARNPEAVAEPEVMFL